MSNNNNNNNTTTTNSLGGEFWHFVYNPYEKRWILERTELVACTKKKQCFYPLVPGRVVMGMPVMGDIT